MKKSIMFLVLVLGAALLSAWKADLEACVGKTIYMGRLPGVEQEILTELFVWLVSERTGTSIEIRAINDSRAGHSALEEAKIDLYMEETIVALREILGRQPVAGGGDAARQVVRKEYEAKYNLIWLEPWGLEGSAGSDGISSKVAPVVRKDTLVKFPALSRLVNKMAGVVDDKAMEQLLAESSRKPVREVTKKFLKQKKLI